MPIWQRFLLSCAVTAIIVGSYHILQQKPTDKPLSLECREAMAVERLQKLTGKPPEEQKQGILPDCRRPDK